VGSNAAIAATARDGAGAGVYTAAWCRGLEPPPQLKVWEWAERERVLPEGRNAEPGPYRASRTPYLIEIMENLSRTSSVWLTVAMKGAQVGFTTAGENWLGQIIGEGGGPSMWVQPTVDVAKRWSKSRINTMITATPALADRVTPTKSRDGDSSTQLSKEFPGGSLTITGANSAVAMRQASIQNLGLDEIDGYPPDVDGEGDPVLLAWKRTNTYERTRKIFELSTPTVRGASRIEAAFEETDQRYYNVPCPHCGTLQVIQWKQIKWDKENPAAGAWLECAHCEARIDEHHKTAMLAAGTWIPTAESKRPGVRGYHLSALYSPLGWYSWTSAVLDFLEAKRSGNEALQTWTNTVLAETWEEGGEQLAPEILLNRCEEFEAEAPADVLLVTAGVDVQANRLELEAVGWGLGSESWSLDYRVLSGDPSKDRVWHQLEDYLERTWEHADGDRLPLAGMAVDSGYMAHSVYDFVEGQAQFRNVHAIKGQGGWHLPLVGAPRRQKRGRGKLAVDLYMVGVDNGKAQVYSRLAQRAHGPGFCHFPAGRSLDYFEQLTAEKLVTRYTRGVPVKVWHQTRARNEGLDCRVYASAELAILAPVWDVLARKRQEAREGTAEESTQAPRSKRRSRWVTGY